MKTKLQFAFLLISVFGYSQDPIFNPTMTITSHTVTSSPVFEEVDKIIDGDQFTKFLDFDFNDGMGFTVDLGGVSRVARSISMTTANDAVGRDPMNFEVLGSNDGTNFTSIANGSIPCDDTRFLERNFAFSNTDSYLFYRVIYSTQCAPENSIQVAETQLFDEALSLDDYQLGSQNIKILPNPNSGEFVVSFSENFNIEKILITDISGKVINDNGFQNEIMRQKSYNLKGLRTGVYFISVISDQGKITKKFIIF